MPDKKKISKIAFIDSGYGGLLLSAHIHKNFPGVEVIYMGDTKNMPYGEKEISFLDERYRAFQKQAKQMGVDLLVVACNTLSATSYQTEDKLVDTVDIISISVDYLNRKKIEKLALVATPNTIKSNIYQSHLNKNINLQEVPAKNLASLIENSTLSDVQVEFKNLVGDFDGDIMLGCTHYSVLSSMYPNLNMISQDTILDEFLRQNYSIENKQNSTVKLFVNAELEKYLNFARNLFNKGDFEIKQIDF